MNILNTYKTMILIYIYLYLSFKTQSKFINWNFLCKRRNNLKLFFFKEIRTICRTVYLLNVTYLKFYFS